MSISGLGSMVNRMMAENAVASDEANRTIREAGYEQSQAQLDARNRKKKIANDLESAAGWVEIAQSAAKTVQSGVKMGEAAADYQAFQDAEGGLTDATDSAQEGDFNALMQTQLGEDGPTVDERFGEDRTRALLSDDIQARPGETRDAWQSRVGENLEEMGFTEGEVDQIYDMAKDGEVSTEEVVGFLWANKQDPEAAKAEQQAKATVEQIIGQITSFATRGAGEVAKDERENAQEVEEVADDLSNVAAEAQGQAVDHNEAINEISLQGLRERLGQHATRN